VVVHTNYEDPDGVIFFMLFVHLVSLDIDDAIAQVIRHWLLTVEPSVQSQVFSREIQSGQSGPGESFSSSTSVFSC
jgi:hypothetical protein